MILDSLEDISNAKVSWAPSTASTKLLNEYLMLYLLYMTWIAGVGV